MLHFVLKKIIALCEILSAGRLSEGRMVRFYVLRDEAFKH